MKITKIMNNNAVSSLNEQGIEIVVMGRGIAFKKHVGDLIDESMIDKVFLLSGKTKTNQFMELVEKIPYEHIQTASEIIAYAKCSLNQKLNDKIYIALTDHISFAIDRQNQGIQLKNALNWEIKRFYNHEFLIGKEALQIIKRHLGVELPEDEASFIALHLVNAELDTDMNQSLRMVKIIQDIESIVKYHFHITLDEESLSYERFLTHLKFFVQRVARGQCYETEDEDFCRLIKNQYKDAYACVMKIQEYVEKQLKYEMTEEEAIYLTVHIKRVADVQRELTR